MQNNNEKNKVTVVIVARNSGLVLFECLQALNENDDATKPQNVSIFCSKNLVYNIYSNIFPKV